jgi:hypothetical protein
MASNPDFPKDDRDSLFRAELAAALAAPAKRGRRATPPEFRTREGRLALPLWREQALYSLNRARYGDWWALLLDAGTAARIEHAIAPFASYDALMAAYWKHQRPNAVRSEVDSERASWEELCEQLPRPDFDEFSTVLSKPVKERVAFAEDFGKRATRTLKEFLKVPAHRPKVRPSKTDFANDKWLCRLAAYILNFPEDFR